MGPLATIDIFKKIVINTPAKNDQEHIPILVANIPQVPDRTKSILENGPSPVPKIVDSGKKLESAGADFLIIPCNTSHYYFEEISKSFKIPVLNMIDLTVEALKDTGYKKIAVLGTEGTLRAGMYQRKLKEDGFINIDIDEKDYDIISYVIYDVVKTGDFTKDISEFLDLLKRLKEKGVETVILGCTELPLLFEKYKIDTEYIDPTMILAKKAVDLAF